MEGFCVSKLCGRNSYSIKWVMFEHLCLKEAHFRELEFLRKVWLIQNSETFLIYLNDINNAIISINVKIIKNFCQIYWQIPIFVLKLIGIMLKYDLNMKLLPGSFRFKFHINKNRVK